MGLRTDAEKLIQALEAVAAGLVSFRGSSVQMEYTEHLRRRLVPLVEELKALINDRADRLEILRTMAELKEVMHEVTGAATKGEMNICHEGVLKRFWDLSTSFQELRYRNKQL